MFYDFAGVVKKIGMLKITHEKYKHTKKGANEVLDEFVQSFDEAFEHNRELETLVPKAQETLNPLMVLTMFRQIPTEVSILILSRYFGKCVSLKGQDENASLLSNYLK